MNLLSRRSLLAIAAVVDIAIHARPDPVAAKHLAERHHLPPRHLETILQALVRAGILKGVRGPKGGYELATERRRIAAGNIVRAVMDATDDEASLPEPHSILIDDVIEPEIKQASQAFLAHLDHISVEELCHRANRAGFSAGMDHTDFTI
jgi:Rrf2 family iron-sulfur cluster assembly transcriptional regulator